MNNLIQRLQKFNGQYPPWLLKIKYKRISENPFSFFRGTCHLFYEDLHQQNPLSLSPSLSLSSSPISWICGDLHIENFGSFKGNNRLVYFDLNDFGESMLAPVNWEIARMITSMFIAFDSLKINVKEAETHARSFLQHYCDTLKRGKALYIEPQIAKGIVRTFLENISKRKQKDLLEKRIERNGDKTLLLIDDERHFMLDKDLKIQLYHFIEEWAAANNIDEHYTCLDVAFHIAGTGSIGAARYCFLFGHKKKAKRFLLLDMKETGPSSLAPFNSTPQPPWQDEAQRICVVQDYMQNNCPALLSPVIFNNKPYVIKELQPSADKINFKLIKDRLKDISATIRDMAVLTASAQLRSAGRKGAVNADELIAFGERNDWQDEVFKFGMNYKEQVKRDYEEFVKFYKKEGLNK